MKDELEKEISLAKKFEVLGKIKDGRYAYCYINGHPVFDEERCTYYYRMARYESAEVNRIRNKRIGRRY
ncbi:MAG: hypothetical protein ACLFP2_04305 [Candidatus Woesearchaeota archaeon]